MENKTQPTDINVGQLELKHIAKYLPNGLKIDASYYEISEPQNVVCYHDINGLVCTDYGLASYSSGKRIESDYAIEHVKPILRTPYITKPITHKGETFVPLVELAKIAFPKYADMFKLENGVVETVFGYSFDFFENTKTFTYNGQSCDNQEPLFEKLSEWMFDTKNLIKSGLAVDVETLDTNPYA